MFFFQGLTHGSMLHNYVCTHTRTWAHSQACVHTHIDLQSGITHELTEALMGLCLWAGGVHKPEKMAVFVHNDCCTAAAARAYFTRDTPPKFGRYSTCIYQD